MRRAPALGVGLGFALLPGLASAHGAGAHEGGVASSAAAEIPGVLLLVAAGGAPYFVGVRRLWRRAGAGRGISRLEATAYVAGLIVIAVALAVPAIVPVTEEFSGHMAQHLLLIVVGAPLLAFGRPGVAIAWALRETPLRGVPALGHDLGRRRLVRAMTTPAGLLLVYVAAVWIWHLPTLYNAAAEDVRLHFAEHASLIAASFAFWWRVRSLQLGGAVRKVTAVCVLFAVMLPELALGAFITFARSPLYDAHRLATESRGGDAVADQQLGGLAMLMIGGMLFVGAALAGALRLLSAEVIESTPRVPAANPGTGPGPG